MPNLASSGARTPDCFNPFRTVVRLPFRADHPQGGPGLRFQSRPLFSRPTCQRSEIAAQSSELWLRHCCLGPFLEQARGKSVWEADRSDVTAFHKTRRNGKATNRIARTSWNRSVATLDKLYRWGVEEGLINQSPFSYRQVWKRAHGGGQRQHRIGERLSGPLPAGSNATLWTQRADSIHYREWLLIRHGFARCSHILRTRFLSACSTIAFLIQRRPSVWPKPVARILLHRRFRFASLIGAQMHASPVATDRCGKQPSSKPKRC
jgi:hypothetical protein